MTDGFAAGSIGVLKSFAPRRGHAFIFFILKNVCRRLPSGHTRQKSIILPCFFLEMKSEAKRSDALPPRAMQSDALPPRAKLLTKPEGTYL